MTVSCCIVRGRSSVVIDSNRSFGPDPMFFDYIVREVNASSRVHVIAARKLRLLVIIIIIVIVVVVVVVVVVQYCTVHCESKKHATFRA